MVDEQTPDDAAKPAEQQPAQRQEHLGRRGPRRLDREAVAEQVCSAERAEATAVPGSSPTATPDPPSRPRRCSAPQVHQASAPPNRRAADVGRTRPETTPPDAITPTSEPMAPSGEAPRQGNRVEIRDEAELVRWSTPSAVPASATGSRGSRNRGGGSWCRARSTTARSPTTAAAAATPPRAAATRLDHRPSSEPLGLETRDRPDGIVRRRVETRRAPITQVATATNVVTPSPTPRWSGRSAGSWTAAEAPEEPHAPGPSHAAPSRRAIVSATAALSRQGARTPVDGVHHTHTKYGKNSEIAMPLAALRLVVRFQRAPNGVAEALRAEDRSAAGSVTQCGTIMMIDVAHQACSARSSSTGSWMRDAESPARTRRFIQLFTLLMRSALAKRGRA